MRGDAGEVAFAIAIGVCERAWVDLVEHSITPPWALLGGSRRHRSDASAYCLTLSAHVHRWPDAYGIALIARRLMSATDPNAMSDTTAMGANRSENAMEVSCSA